jgi:hypothetical protein
VLPIRDITRRVQISLFGASLLVVILARLLFRLLGKN